MICKSTFFFENNMVVFDTYQTGKLFNIEMDEIITPRVLWDPNTN